MLKQVREALTDKGLKVTEKCEVSFTSGFRLECQDGHRDTSLLSSDKCYPHQRAKYDNPSFLGEKIYH